MHEHRLEVPVNRVGHAPEVKLHIHGIEKTDLIDLRAPRHEEIYGQRIENDSEHEHSERADRYYAERIALGTGPITLVVHHRHIHLSLRPSALNGAAIQSPKKRARFVGFSRRPSGRLAK